jgi:hypothetical protein
VDQRSTIISLINIDDATDRDENSISLNRFFQAAFNRANGVDENWGAGARRFPFPSSNLAAPVCGVLPLKISTSETAFLGR